MRDNRHRWAGLALAGALTLSLGACQSGPSGAAQGDEAKKPAKKPFSKSTTDTDDAAMGQLPEGIGVPVGEAAPDAAVTDLKGEPVSLASLYAEGPIMLVFYRGGWCPYCNFQIHELSEGAAEFKKRGVTPVAISVDDVDYAAATDAAWEIPFPVLSDGALAAHTAFSVLNKIDDKTVKRYKMMGLDLEERSGQAHHTIAVPSIFIIDRGGVVRWAHADTDYKVRPTNAQLWAVIDGLAL